MSDEPSPRPWRVEPMFNGVADARGEKVAANICPADAALIVAAVNEREHLRAQIAATVSEALAIREERDRLREALNRVGHLANDLRNITERDTEVRADVNEIVDVCRAAIGEDKP